MINERALILLLALAISACAELPEQSAEARAERVYRTGSNVPVHERTSSGRVLTLDGDSTEELIRRAQPLPMPSPVRSSN
jgi:hypothetical protein